MEKTVKIKEVGKKIYKSDKFPLIVFTIILALIHVLMQKHGDDITFSSMCNNTNFLNCIILRYQEWTSRIIIEGILIIFANYLPMFIWKIASIGMCYLLVYSISELFIEKNKRNLNTILCICLLTIITLLRETGWMATINNYLWVAATGLYAIIPLKKIIKQEKISKIQNILYILAIIYACNQEQMAGILFIVYTCVLAYLIKHKNTKPITIILYGIIILSLILVITCPGNISRNIQEEQRWYPGFSNLSLLTKVENGVTSMMDYVVQSGRILFFALLILISYTIWQKNKNTFLRLIGLSPLILTIIYKEVYRILIEYEKTTFMQESTLYLIFKLGIYISILVLIGVCLYIIFKKINQNKNMFYISLITYISGIASRLVMAFSPTIYASGERTCFFWYISFCILIILILETDNKKTDKIITKIKIH